MAMNDTEINKVNDLYKRFDVLAAENSALKSNTVTDTADLVARLCSIENKLDQLNEALDSNQKRKTS